MPTHSLLPFVESPDGLAQDILISNSANIPGPGSSMTPHTTHLEKQSGGGSPLSCMFCDQTFIHQDELGPHVLTQHPTTFFEPTVLRVEAEFRIPGERVRPKPSSIPKEVEEVHSCIVCCQVSQDAGELEAHMRKHKDYFTYCCNVCGRRFREPWFLKNHMKMHVKPGARSKAQQDQETPATVNGVAQEPAPEPVATVYKMCMVCGFFFPDHDSLVEHSKVHNREAEHGRDKDKEDTDASTESLPNQVEFLRGLNLVPRDGGNSLQHERSSKWIPQLDPYNTYQAWQLATKGKIAVGPNNIKDIGQEASTDNEECNSDKEELHHIWSEDQGDKAAKEVQGKELRPQTVAETPGPQRRSLMQKDKGKERPTTCEVCRRTFRTYHQLVLHSRVHKRERVGVGGESPTSSSVDGKLPRVAKSPGSLEPAEEGSEEAALSENFGPGDDGFDRSKVRSKACSYCGKTFRSSYYLTVHLRTHTGEKPFKCAYCDYAAAQKTSLKYHLERRHKNKPYVDIPSRPVPSPPSPSDGKRENGNESPTPDRPTLWARSCGDGSPLDNFDTALGKPGTPLAHHNKLIAKSTYSPPDAVLMKCPLPVNVKMEREDIKEENSQGPLDLSLKVSLSVYDSAEPRNVLIPIACSFCEYKTMYPEVLIMHKRLTHKDKSDSSTKSGYGGGLKQKRFTGCPPALDGKDVSPLPMIERRHPRRTKSPPPQPAKTQEKTPLKPPSKPPSKPPQPHPPQPHPPQPHSPQPHPPQPPQPHPPQPHARKWSPVHAAPHNVVQETQRYRQNVDPAHSSQESSSRYTELMRKSNPGSNKYVLDLPCPPDRVGVGERSYPGVIWHSEAARLCLSTRFGSLPQMDFGESSNKRLKYSVPAGREADVGERPGFRGLTPDGSGRLIISGRAMKTAPQMSGSSTLPDTAIGGGLDSEWSMMNLLRPYTPTDLAALYQSTSSSAAHGALANPRAGGRAVLYQHLPTLPNLQRRDPSGPFPHQRYGATDKST